MLAGREVPNDSADADWAWFEVAGDGDRELHVTVSHADGVEVDGRLTRGDPCNGDVYCEDGCLKIPERWIPDRWDEALPAQDAGAPASMHAMACRRIARAGGVARGGAT
jgi:hypothetical protein